MTYILLKDLPGVLAGTIYFKNGDRYYPMHNGIKPNFPTSEFLNERLHLPISIVENNPEWFSQTNSDEQTYDWSVETIVHMNKPNMNKDKKLNEAMQCIDYSNALEVVREMPKFYLGQEVETKDGKGILVHMLMDYNGLFIKPSTSRVTVWYSTDKAFLEGTRCVNSSYMLSEIKPIK